MEIKKTLNKFGLKQTYSCVVFNNLITCNFEPIKEKY